MSQNKYIFVNGVMMQNPQYVPPQQSQPQYQQQAPPAYSPPQQLAILTSMNDIANANTMANQSNMGNVQLSQNTVYALECVQGEEYAQNFTPNCGGASMLDGISNIFSQYEIPVGILSKLLELQKYRLSFIVDDSGSMNLATDVLIRDGTSYIQQKVAMSMMQQTQMQPGGFSSVMPQQGMYMQPGGGYMMGQQAPMQQPMPNNGYMTRWQEAENRLHVLIDIISYIPVKEIVISFLNDRNVMILSQRNKTPEFFANETHAAISQLFSAVIVKYMTPTYAKLSQAFKEAMGYPDPTMTYFLTDGVPSDQGVDFVFQLIRGRQRPDYCPLVLISCTNVDSECEWMKQVILYYTVMDE
jgi:hypothetical protein